MDVSSGRWALLSDGNPDNLKKFFQGIREQACETAGLIVAPPHKRDAIIEADLDWPNRWSLYQSGSLHASNDQWFGLLWDDQCPEAAKWDVTMVTRAAPWSVVTSLEATNGDWRQGAIVWGLECFRAGGKLNLKDLDQCLIDWARAAHQAQCWYLERTVQLPRRTGPEKKDFQIRDDAETVKSLKAVMARHGIRSLVPDWSGISLLIATPSMESRPQALYTISITATMRELEKQGTPHQWALERYNADIGLARSHIFSEFFRSNHTHLLMIDDDMTWETSALHRLVFADKPLVAVAGPKKRYPLVFAASHADENGKPLPMMIDQDKSCAEVTSVGAAFMLIRRDCAEAMVKAYPDLEYVGGDSKVSWGVFLQQIANRAYLPEDFSFCQRWRKIGGKVYICPDVPLGHIGAHEFKGDLLSNAQRHQLDAAQ